MLNNDVPRRTFLKVAALGAAGVTLNKPDAVRATLAETHRAAALQPTEDIGVRLGVASYSLRNFTRAKAIEMTKALGTPFINLKSVHLPYDASPAEIAAANPNSGGTGSGGIVYVTSTPPDPGSAQSIAYNMMAGFGFSPATFFGCLKDIWNRESGWRYDAENPSGAYGIPQALPGSKMASAGADWQTNPATQIKWGLGYIKAIYGDPCKAWAFEEANGYY